MNKKHNDRIYDDIKDALLHNEGNKGGTYATVVYLASYGSSKTLYIDFTVGFAQVLKGCFFTYILIVANFALILLTLRKNSKLGRNVIRI